MEFIQIQVAEREETGSSNVRRLRRKGFVPGVLYGMKRRNLSLSIAESELERFLKTGSHLVELRMGGETRPAILREMQIDPVEDHVLHIDFHRVDKDTEVEDDVRLTFKGRAPGIADGGVFTALMEAVRLRCRPALLPRELVVDISHLALGDQIHVGDLELPADVALVTSPEEPIAQVAAPKLVAEEPVEGAEVEAVEGEAAEEGAAPAEGEGKSSED